MTEAMKRFQAQGFTGAGATRKMLEGEESVIRSCQVLSSINPKNVYGATQDCTASMHIPYLSNRKMVTSNYKWLFMGKNNMVKEALRSKSQR